MQFKLCFPGDHKILTVFFEDPFWDYILHHYYEKDESLPKCCIVYADGGFKLWYEGRYYGSEAAKQSQIVSYLEIVVQ